MCIPAAGSLARSVDDGITQFASYADSNAGMDGVEVFGKAVLWIWEAYYLIEFF